MFGMNPLILWSLVGLLFGNVLFATFWQFADARADRYKEAVQVCAAKHEAFTSQVREEGKKAERRTAEIIAEQNKTTEEIKHGYSQKLDRLRADYQRMRAQYAGTGASSGGMPALPEAPTRTDAIPPDCISLAEQSAETTLMLVELQAWTKQQQEANP